MIAISVSLLSLEKTALFFIMRFFLSEPHEDEDVLLAPLVPVDEGRDDDSVSVDMGFPLELGFTEPVELGDGESEPEGSAEGSADEEPPVASFTTGGPGNAYLALAS